MTGMRQVGVPRVLRVGPGALPEVPRLVVDGGFELARTCVVTGAGPSHPHGAAVADGLRAAGVKVELRTATEGTLDEAARLASQVISEDWTVLIGVGGGRVIDVAKLAAARTGLEFVSVPTTAAHDGLCSPVATLAGADLRRKSHAARMPAGVVLDTDVLLSAPVRTLRAGVGDLLSNLTALMDWQRADALGLEKYDEYSAMIAESAARAALDIVDPTDSSSVIELSRGLVLSGLAMATAGTSRPCSGAEHLVSHSLDHLRGPEAALHGEQVALGTLLAAMAHGELFSELRKVLVACGLATRPKDLGIPRDVMLQAICGAPATRPDRWTILTEAISNEADAAHLCSEAFGADW